MKIKEVTGNVSSVTIYRINETFFKLEIDVEELSHQSVRVTISDNYIYVYEGRNTSSKLVGTIILEPENTEEEFLFKNINYRVTSLPFLSIDVDLWSDNFYKDMEKQITYFKTNKELEDHEDF